MTGREQQARYRLLVFSDDWGRHPSSCQHLVGRLLPRYPTDWVNTIGMRSPTMDRATLSRGVEKLREWSGGRAVRQACPENLRVISPPMWPWMKRRFDRWLNARILTRRLKPMLASQPDPVIAITTIPTVADMIDRLPVSRWVYYCVDDFSKWPGLDHEAVAEMEKVLVAKADRLIAVSATLQERLAALGRSSELLTHGVDLDFWQSATPSELAADLPRPLVLFWGVVDRRMDVPFVARLGQQLRAGTVLLVGPLQDPDPALLELPRVVHLPAVRLQELPSLAAAADVLIMPYRDIPVTRAMQPLKLKEYLACEKAVVARDLPSTQEWADCLDLAGSADEFSILVRRRLAEGLPPAQQVARQRLVHENWAAKAGRFEQLAILDAVPTSAAAS